MSEPLPARDGEDWLAALRQAAAALSARLEAHCQAVEAGVRTLFDERTQQRATLTGLRQAFERETQREEGLGDFCTGQDASRKFVEESAFGWVRAEELSTVARRAWDEAGTALKPVAQTGFGLRWSAARGPLGTTPGALSEAVFAGASEVAQLFGDDFEFTATAAARKLRTAFGTFLALPQRSLWQTGYWLNKPAVDPPPPAPPSSLARLIAWLRRLFGRPAEVPEQGPRFVDGGVTLDVLPRPAPMQRTLWACHEERSAEAGRLNEDVAAWTREFTRSEKALARAGERQAKANEPIERKVTAKDVAEVVSRADALIGDFAALREKTRPHLDAT